MKALEKIFALLEHGHTTALIAETGEPEEMQRLYDIGLWEHHGVMTSNYCVDCEGLNAVVPLKEGGYGMRCPKDWRPVPVDDEEVRLCKFNIDRLRELCEIGIEAERQKPKGGETMGL